MPAASNSWAWLVASSRAEACVPALQVAQCAKHTRSSLEVSLGGLADGCHMLDVGRCQPWWCTCPSADSPYGIAEAFNILPGEINICIYQERERYRAEYYRFLIGCSWPLPSGL